MRLDKNFLVVILLIVIGPVALQGWWRQWSASHARDLYSRCQDNERAIGTAQEMYSTDNQGRFAPRLSLLVPKYLPAIPPCPALGRDTYSPGFRSCSNPDAYTVMCLGGNHEDAPVLGGAEDLERVRRLLGVFGAANQPVVSSLGPGWHTER